MKKGLVFLLFFLAAGMFSSSLLFAEPTNCGDFEQRIKTTSRAGKMVMSARLYLQAERAHVCSGGALVLLGRMTAFAHMRKAFSDDDAQETRERLLKKALRFGRPWQVIASIGDIEKAGKHWQQAAAYYLEALDDMSNKLLNPIPPKQQVRETIGHKLKISRMLAPDYEPLLMRCGQLKKTKPDNETTMAIKYRGCSAVAGRALLPVTFASGSARLDKKAGKILADILGFLEQSGFPDIRLNGHSDPIGSSVKNLRLSRYRARVVKTWFRRHGYKGKIHISGKGESKQFAVDNASYDEGERNRLHRRVEIIR